MQLEQMPVAALVSVMDLMGWLGVSLRTMAHLARRGTMEIAQVIPAAPSRAAQSYIRILDLELGAARLGVMLMPLVRCPMSVPALWQVRRL
jgi:hypothetical protein